MKKIVIFGDSIAAGLFNGKITHCLDRYLQETLEDLNFPDFSIVNLGEKGESSATAYSRRFLISQENPDIVIINVGINDAINISDNLKLYQENLTSIITEVQKAHVLLAGPSYVNEKIKTQANQHLIQKYNLAAKTVADRLKIPFIDVYQQMISLPNPQYLLQNDGLHPSKLGYHLLAVLIAEQIVKKNKP